ncbi:pro-neuregulin-1, membrane-bound isoform isoform X2 [Betta splendens]|uniref:Pro-neuregulin-1, membrane-bound isoform isoform X2 n=1 Tax=Betta splendens TaxID=158456 RepID=A0A9W2Y650_BETSP|nr:pro-neuregulin-1, membrane-bound isoform isoform X2 [Betta splendens]
MTEGMDDLSAGPAATPGSTSPTCSAVDTGQVPEEKPEEAEAAAESGEEGAEGAAEGSAAGDGEHLGALGIVALPGTCCVCIEMEHISSCLHSEKICILPILACLLSLALCTAGLKWVFVDRIFEYEPPTHLDPKPIGQDPVIIADPTQGLPVSTAGHPEDATQRPRGSESPGATLPDPSVTLKYNAERPTGPKQTPRPQTTQESNDIPVPTVSTTSSTTSAKTSHVTPCSDKQKNYCVNGGECFTLEIMPGSTKFLCRCPNEFTGDRCQSYVMASFYKRLGIEFMAEELYQKRILTITGICIALLVVGIMCVVAYCKTKKQRKTLHDRLRQRLKSQRQKTNTGAGHNPARARPVSNLALQDLQLNNCNGKVVQPAAEEETEATTSGNEPPALPHSSSQRLHPACQASPLTPASPPSEASAPLSSLAASVSPCGGEAAPLLLSKRASTQGPDRRMSAHYNHGHVAHSSPPSPLPGTAERNGCSSCDSVLGSDSEQSSTVLLLKGRRTKAAPARPDSKQPQGLH